MVRVNWEGAKTVARCVFVVGSSIGAFNGNVVASEVRARVIGGKETSGLDVIICFKANIAAVVAKCGGVEIPRNVRGGARGERSSEPGDSY